MLIRYSILLVTLLVPTAYADTPIVKAAETIKWIINPQVPTDAFVVELSRLGFPDEKFYITTHPQGYTYLCSLKMECGKPFTLSTMHPVANSLRAVGTLRVIYSEGITNGPYFQLRVVAGSPSIAYEIPIR